MAHYLIFIPHKLGADPDHLTEVGLGELLRDGEEGPKFSDLEQTGPGKLPGQILTWHNQERQECNPALGYLPDRQTWLPARPDPERQLPAGRFWYGIETERPPRPIDLQRRQLYDGFELTLGDGQTWGVPNCLSLPHQFDLDDDGHPYRRVKATFEEIFQRALWAFSALEKEVREEEEIAWQEGFRYCCEILSLNYRINAEIAARLGLFDDQNFANVMSYTIDRIQLQQIIKDAKKKKEQSNSPETSAA